MEVESESDVLVKDLDKGVLVDEDRPEVGVDVVGIEEDVFNDWDDSLSASLD